ncbi:hypothetical protein F2Q68_00033937 [Brassica cretica]|nr:hypothetical protein F2Q68_00033937 [Brassica cretica]
MIRGVGEDIATASKMVKKIWRKLKSQSERREDENLKLRSDRRNMSEKYGSKLAVVLTYNSRNRLQCPWIKILKL